jgi:ATP-binding cassette subfamily C protein
LHPAAILIAIFLFVRLYLRLSQTQQNIQILRSNYAPSIVPATEILQAARAEAEAKHEFANPLVIDTERGARLMLRDIGVAYDGRSVLSGITLDIAPGTVIGFAGRSGAGKSTLVDCLLGLVEPQSGTVEIAGRALNELPLGSWRRTIGYVAQDTFLFNASIRENVRWGNIKASDADIENAVRQAHADEFISLLPQGLDTEVGDRGVRLSGGQRQRIGLARALVGHRSLLVLDEATSALDSESERIVMDAIAELRGHMTILIVAHRLSTLRDADRICLMEDGRIVETGGWSELLAHGSRFSALWRMQTAEANEPLSVQVPGLVT